MANATWCRSLRTDDWPRWVLIVCGIIAIGSSSPYRSAAQDAAPNGPPTVTLDERQQSLMKRHQRLEELLLRLAEVEAAENPERAALLRQAAGQSRDKFIANLMKTAGESIRSGQYKRAIDSQTDVAGELKLLLELLQSEDRSSRIRDEKQRYQKLMADLKRNLNNQRSTRAKTESGQDLKQAAEQQKSVTRRSESLKEKLSKENGTESKPSSEDKPSKPSEKDSKQSEKDSKPSDKEPKPSDKNSEPSDKNSKPSDKNPKPSDKNSKPSDRNAKPSDQPSKPSEQHSQSSDSPSPPQTPEQRVEEQLEKAVERMKEAQEELDRSKRDPAVDKQLAAEEELRKAIDELEKILRQLREEEKERKLAKLESRVRKMLAMQVAVNDDTTELGRVPKVQRDRSTDLKAGKISLAQKAVTEQADRAMLVLREEGSSVAFPEVLSQIRADTVTAGERLSQTKIDALTQGIQADIVAGLEEMADALARERKEMEQKKQGGQKPSQSGRPGEEPLIAAIAELKLIRTMETRIRKTTQRYDGRLQSAELSASEALPLLQNLADRQRRLYKITRDLVKKRNQ